MSLPNLDNGLLILPNDKPKKPLSLKERRVNQRFKLTESRQQQLL